MNAYQNKNGVKLLAAILMLALVFTGAAVLMSDNQVSADKASATEISENTLDGYTFVSGTEYKLTQDVTVSQEVDLSGCTLYLDGHTITVTGGTLTSSSGKATIIEDTADNTDNMRIGILGGVGAGTIENLKFQKIAPGNVKESSEYQCICISYGTATVNNVEFDVDDNSKIDGTFFAISINNSNGGIVLDTITLNGGAIKYPGAGALEIKNTRNITLNVAGVAGSDLTLDSSVVKLTGSNISKTILGLMGVPDEKTTGNGSIDVIIIGSFDLGTLEFGIGNNSDTKITMDASTAKVDYTGGDGITITKNNSDRTGIDNNVIALEGDIVIDGDAYLVGDVTIPADKTVIIRNGGSLDLYKNDLTLLGDLVIENKGKVIGTDGTEKIILKSGAVIENNGAIGGAIPVSVYADKADGDSYATLQNIVGVSFGLIRSGESAPFTYTLSVTGDVSRAAGTSSSDDKILDINGAIVNGDLSTSKDVTLKGTFTVARNGSVTTDGPMSATVTLQNGSEITVNGAFNGTINAEALEGMTSAQADANTFTAEQVTSFTSTGTADVSGFSVSVSRVQYTNDDGDVMFNQRAYLSGDIDTTINKTEAQLTITGNAFVASGVTVTIDAEYGSIAATDGTGLIIVDGTIANVAEADDFAYVGAFYTVEDENGDETGYITSFDAAMKNIAYVANNTIYVSGNNAFPIEVTGTYTLEENQFVESQNGVAAIEIAESGKLTINDGAEFDATTIKAIDGMVIVMYGGDCEPSDDLYDVKSENEAGDITYAGLQVVLSNAQSGDVITVTGLNAHANTLTVPNGVTLNIEGALTVDRSVTVAQGGILNLVDGGQLTIGKTGSASPEVKAIAGTFTVNGTADITEGVLTMNGGASGNNAQKATVASTGSLVYTGTQLSAQTNTNVNGAYYTNADAENVLTTVSAAVAGAIEAETVNVTVIGTVNDTTDVTLGGVKMDVQGTAVLGNINVVDSILTVTGTGKLTATVVGQSGEEGSAVPAAIQLNKAVITNATSTDAVNAQNVNVWTLTFNSITGSATISQGTVVASNFTGTQDNSKNVDILTVSSGATLLVNKIDVQISTYKEFNVAGTLEIANNSGLTVLDTVEKMTVSGTMTVNGTAVVEDMIVTGTLDVTDTETIEGSMTVNGALSVGEASETLGATGAVNGPVSLNTARGYVLAYPGTTVAATSFGTEDAVESTQFYINGILYVTAYTLASDIVAIGENTDKGFMNDVEIKGFVTKDVIDDVDNWFSDDVLETALVSANTEYFCIGGADAAYIELEPATAYIQYSAGSQISLFVDGVRITSGDIVPLSVGTHKVVATVNPGFAGDVTITFNGQTVTGEFTVTPEMAGNTINTPIVLSVTGNITQDTPTVSGGDSGDDGMGLTDDLLIILVVLIVIMAIMVAMRLMRS